MAPYEQLGLQLWTLLFWPLLLHHLGMSESPELSPHSWRC